MARHLLHTDQRHIGSRPSFLRSSIILELLDELLTIFEESYLLGSFFVPIPDNLMLAILIELLVKFRSVKKKAPPNSRCEGLRRASLRHEVMKKSMYVAERITSASGGGGALVFEVGYHRKKNSRN